MSLIISVSGIRGTIGGLPGANLTPPDIIRFSSAYAALIKSGTDTPVIVIGRDARISGNMVSNLISSTLISMGIRVIDLGLSTTPTVEMAVCRHKANGGIIITASHNPANWNALKLLNEKGEFISAETGQKLIELADSTLISFSPYDRLGSLENSVQDINYHVNQLLSHPLIAVDRIRLSKFHVSVDCINSTGALAIPVLLDALDCRYTLINGEVTGKFSHNPEPLEENLSDLIQSVSNGMNVGIAVDPDVDRLALVDERGRYIGEEYSLVCAADYVLKNKPGNTVSNLSSSRALADITKKYGCHYFASKVGEVHVVEKMKEVNAVIGGEGNGGIILPDLHYGRDALAGIALVLSHLATGNKTLSSLRDDFPKYEMYKDKIEITSDTDYDEIIHNIQQSYADGKINLTDGIKIDLEQGWLHLRKSNTEPIIRIYSEASTASDAKRLVMQLKELIAKLN
ncbi:MAG: phosphoglucosamine mutase [Saprospiraceae bacterium]|nr:phosphoglucosamine mutase [Saprospiraceae bacterium]HMW38067.1 phosphoglucosamine mutase [Saprospiraceae bacterium]HMX87166.1 phosphoglucosamine mutase [Saprospiraceae bacterium]HMZ38754.1 phosphoglucosamine mutase [Saprospiraceae bacterium]HNA64190.1 phosphoglucosamine mutase [Saprospiraceae bacterium]